MIKYYLCSLFYFSEVSCCLSREKLFCCVGNPFCYVGKRLLLRAFAMTCVFLIVVFVGHARSQDILAVSGIRDVNLAYPLGLKGDLSFNLSFCIVSASSDRRDAERLPYDIKIVSAEEQKGHRVYRVDLLSSADGVPILFSHSDVSDTDRTSLESLNDNQWSTAVHSGQTKGCPRGNNGHLKLLINIEDIISNFDGIYFNTFRLSARGGQNKSKIVEKIFNVILSVPTLLKISGLDNIDFGSYSGSGRLFYEENFCLFSNQDENSRNYRMTFSSGQSRSGRFYLESDMGAAIEYDAYAVHDGNKLLNGQPSPPFSVDRRTSLECEGETDNATMILIIPSNRLQSAADGVFRDTLTVTVEPS